MIAMMRIRTRLLLICSVALASLASAQAPESVARTWNDQLLEAIRGDFARPTVHARNLYHVTAAMYDAYAVYDEEMSPVFLGRTHGNFTFDAPVGLPEPSDLAEARETAMTYVAYRLLRHRFSNSPGRRDTQARIDSVMAAQGRATRMTSTDYVADGPAALGNWIAEQVIAYGLQDGANEGGGYRPRRYDPVNPPLVVNEVGNPDVVDIDRWQPLALTTFIDQSGNPIPGSQQEFVGPEWGDVTPFALDPADRETLGRDGAGWRVYHNPGPPPTMGDTATREFFQRNHELVVRWSALLDPEDTTTLDISPGANGDYLQLEDFPTREGYFEYYREAVGGDAVGGLDVNPITGQPYAPNRVRQADYFRVLAEFWADGPDSETPPGHWFTILNYVLDQPETQRRWRGAGPELDEERFVLQAYLTLAGAMHDAAISTWSVKGYYDSARPVSVIRYMAEKGQRSDPSLPNYHPEGLALVPGQTELIGADDPLAGEDGEYVDELKVRAWRAHENIEDPAFDAAGVDWVLAKAWWPYQLRTFVSPPFAGYVSGHSTFSRAAAEVLTHVTGSAYFPGGLGTFVAPKDEFLVFEAGPVDTLNLTWATYRGAADEVSLSRIYGGIHPPFDDLPGRLIGVEVAEGAVAAAQPLFDAEAPSFTAVSDVDAVYFEGDVGTAATVVLTFSEAVDTSTFLLAYPDDFDANTIGTERAAWTSDRSYEVTYTRAPEQPDYVYEDFQLSVSVEDWYGNAVEGVATAPLFRVGTFVSGLNELSGGNAAELFPNPATDRVEIRTERATSGEVLLRDLTGRIVTAAPLTGFGVSLPLTELSAGVYLVTVTDEAGARVTWKLVKAS